MKLLAFYVSNDTEDGLYATITFQNPEKKYPTKTEIDIPKEIFDKLEADLFELAKIQGV